MTKVSLSKDTLMYSFMFWGQKLSAVIVLPFAITHFTAADFGYYSLIQITASLLFILGMLAVADQGLPRFFMEAKEEGEKKAYVTAAFFISGLGNIVVVALLFISCLFLPETFMGITSPKTLAMLAAGLCLTQTFFYLGNSLLRWTFQIELVLKINLTRSVLASATIIIGILCFGWKAEEALWTIIISNLLAGIWANYEARHFLDFQSPRKNQIKQLLLFSWPLWILNILAFLALYLNNFILARLTNLSDLGIYSLAIFIASLFETLTAGFFYATGPYILATYKEDWAPKKLADYFTRISLIGIACIIILGLWGPFIINFFRGDNAYSGLGALVPWVISGTIFYYLGAYFSPGPYIFKKTYWNVIAFAIAVALNVFLSYRFIPSFGILGAGIAFALSNCFASLLLLLISQKLYPIPLQLLKAFLTIIGVTTFISMIQIKFLVNVSSGISTFLMLLPITVILVALAGILYYRDIKDLDFLKRLAKPPILN
jgi:O-antigen/teichoic acid export membrane protein